jgi:hypothetical protein
MMYLFNATLALVGPGQSRGKGPVALRRRAQAAAQWGRTELPGEGPGPGWLPSGCQHARYVTEMNCLGKWPPPREAVLWTAPSVLSRSGQVRSARRARGTGGRGPDDAPRGLSVFFWLGAVAASG